MTYRFLNLFAITLKKQVSAHNQPLEEAKPKHTVPTGFLPSLLQDQQCH